MRGRRLYFDSSVYGFIDEAGEADLVRDWLKASGHRVAASVEANVGEVLRIPDVKGRERRIRVITMVTQRRTQRPIDMVSAEELLGVDTMLAKAGQAASRGEEKANLPRPARSAMEAPPERSEFRSP